MMWISIVRDPSVLAARGCMNKLHTVSSMHAIKQDDTVPTLDFGLSDAAYSEDVSKLTEAQARIQLA